MVTLDIFFCFSLLSSILGFSALGFSKLHRWEFRTQRTLLTSCRNGYDPSPKKRSIGEGVNENAMRRKRGRPARESDVAGPEADPSTMSPHESEAVARRMEKRRCQYCARVFSRIEHRVRHEKTTRKWLTCLSRIAMSTPLTICRHGRKTLSVPVLLKGLLEE